MVPGQPGTDASRGQGKNQNSTRLLMVASPQPNHIKAGLLPVPTAVRCTHKKRQTSSMVATAPALISAGRYGAGANSKFSGLSNSFIASLLAAPLVNGSPDNDRPGSATSTHSSHWPLRPAGKAMAVQRKRLPLARPWCSTYNPITANKAAASSALARAAPTISVIRPIWLILE